MSTSESNPRNVLEIRSAPISRRIVRLGATNSWLYSQSRGGQFRYERDKGYVCTFSALIVKSTKAHLFHIGDARIYRVHGETLEQLTDDHRIRISGEKSFLGRALGVGARLDVDYRALSVEEGATFVLLTDGVHEHVSEAQIALAVHRHAGDLLTVLAP